MKKQWMYGMASVLSGRGILADAAQRGRTAAAVRPRAAWPGTAAGRADQLHLRKRTEQAKQKQAAGKRAAGEQAAARRAVDRILGCGYSDHLCPHQGGKSGGLIYPLYHSGPWRRNWVKVLLL